MTIEPPTPPPAAPDPMISEGPRGWAARLCRSLLAGALAAVAAGLVESRWVAESGAVTPGVGVTTGLVAPVAIMVAGVVGAVLIALAPSRAPGAREVRSWLEPADAATRVERSVLLLTAPAVATVVIVASSHAAYHLFAADLPSRAAGAASALAAVALALVAGLSCLGLARAVASAKVSPKLTPPAAAALGVLTAIALLALGIASGDTGGRAGGFGILGVLKREELDLRAPGLALGFALACAAGPAMFRRVPGPAALVAALGIASTVLLAGNATPEDALAIRRGAPLGRLALGALQRATDGDHDGYSHRFGGGDCDPVRSSVSPGAEDVPENGVDEDCSGADEARIVLQRAPAAPANATGAIRSKIPAGLNVVLITIDTLRHDLGYMGYERPVSRSIDALAARSVVFERAYSLASYTGKSLGPMLVGKYTSETHRNWGHFNVFGKEDTFIHTRLKAAGIFTMSVQGHWYFGPSKQGIGGGFDLADLSAAPRVAAIEGDTTVNSDKTTDAAIRLLSDPANVGRRFYMWVHYVDPHAEYVRHDEFAFGNKGRELYDGEVAFTDKQVGRLLDHIGSSDLGARTAIVLTSDHGEGFGEHGIFRHGHELWEELVRVPLIVHVPGVSPRRHKVRRSIIDVVPTVLELYGLPLPSGKDDDFVSGRSLLPDVIMPEGHAPEERIVFVDMSAGPYNDERQAFIENGVKLHAAAGRGLGLYDLEKDPGEKEDLLKKDKALAEREVGRFKAFRRELREVVVRAPK